MSRLLGRKLGARATWAVLLTVAALTLLGCREGEQPPTAAPAPGPVEVEAHAIRLEPGEITYSVRITNRSDDQLGNLTLRFELPEGATLQEVLATPLGSHAEESDEAVTWAVPTLPAWTILGPFAYRVTVEGDPGPVEAVARWQTPAEGEASATVAAVEDASQPQVTVQMAAGAFTDIPDTGIRYFVPAGDRGAVTITRLDVEPPAGTAEGQAWVAAYEITKENPGSLILVVPLARPARPYSLVRVFVEGGDGVFREQAVMGTVTGDGQHAAIAADSASMYVLGVDNLRLNEAFTDIQRRSGEATWQEAFEGLVGIEGTLAEIDAIFDLIFSSRTEAGGDGEDGEDDGLGAFLFGLLNGLYDWLFGDEEAGDGGDEGSGCAGDEAVTCAEPDGSGGPCDGHGGGVTTYYPGGDSHSTCADGSEIDIECIDGDGDGYCSVDDEDDNDPDVHFAPVPGPCPYGICFIDTGSGEVFPSWQVEGLLPTIADLLDLGQLIFQLRIEVTPPTALQVQAPSRHLDAGGLRAIVGVVGDNIFLTIPGGQSVQVVLGLPRFVAGLEALPMPAEPEASPVTTEEAPPPMPPEEPSPAEGDRDGDGIPDSSDGCPSEPEDLDGYQDANGCPDSDNDGDGIADASDKCPNEAEDKDGYQDSDGCPDPDNDGDGIADASDQCPNDPEDKDGYKDSDGCPDPDNDGDGIPDASDKCPNQAEDKDGWQDNDGCPEPDSDSDGDGIPDSKDQCPKVPEDYDGVKDGDGCPE